MAKVNIRGIVVGGKFPKLVGSILTEDIIDSFVYKEWVPEYQREVIKRQQKVDELMDIFREDKPLDTIKLNLVGKYEHRGSNTYQLKGELHLIDGLQRVAALVQSGVRTYELSAEVYLNLPHSEELKLFHQFNDKATKLTTSNLIWSYESLMGDMLRRVTRSRSMPIRISLNRTADGLTASTWCTLAYWIYRKMAFPDGSLEQKVLYPPNTGTTKRFMNSQELNPALLPKVEVTIRKLLAEYVRVFGQYDSRTVVYSKPFFLAWNHIVINQFLTRAGELEYGRWAKKVNHVEMLRTDSLVIQCSKNTTATDGHIENYNNLINCHFNYKMQYEVPEITPKDRAKNRLSEVILDGKI